jgi:F-type H+-transporting ATPase subunit b
VIRCLSVARGAALLLLLPQAALAAGDGHFWWEVGNLVFLLGVLFYFARKPVLAYLSERRGGIQKDLESSEELLASSEARLAEWEAKAAGLDAEFESIKETTRKAAQAQKETILADARASAERIRESAAAVVERELLTAREELRVEVADMAVAMAASILREQVSDPDQSRLVDEFITRIEQGDA